MMKTVLMMQIKQKEKNSPELPTKVKMGAVLWTARKIMKNWMVTRELVTVDLRSGENHSAGRTYLLI